MNHVYKLFCMLRKDKKTQGSRRDGGGGRGDGLDVESGKK